VALVLVLVAILAQKQCEREEQEWPELQQAPMPIGMRAKMMAEMMMRNDSAGNSNNNANQGNDDR